MFDHVLGHESVKAFVPGMQKAIARHVKPQNAGEQNDEDERSPSAAPLPREIRTRAAKRREKNG
jgi:hypothetical protein